MFRFLFILFLSFNFLYSIDFAKKYGYETDYYEAVKKAKKEKKDIVFVLVSDYCPWCDRLKEEILSLEYTEEILDEHYISLIINGSYNGDFPDRFDKYIVPTIHFVSYKDESIKETVMGFNNANYRFFEIIEEKAEK